jgi:hypothetical protein
MDSIHFHTKKPVSTAQKQLSVMSFTNSTTFKKNYLFRNIRTTTQYHWTGYDSSFFEPGTSPWILKLYNFCHQCMHVIHTEWCLPYSQHTNQTLDNLMALHILCPPIIHWHVNKCNVPLSKDFGVKIFCYQRWAVLWCSNWATVFKTRKYRSNDNYVVWKTSSTITKFLFITVTGIQDLLSPVNE